MSARAHNFAGERKNGSNDGIYGIADVLAAAEAILATVADHRPGRNHTRALAGTADD